MIDVVEGKVIMFLNSGVEMKVRTITWDKTLAL